MNFGSNELAQTVLAVTRRTTWIATCTVDTWTAGHPYSILVLILVFRAYALYILYIRE